MTKSLAKALRLERAKNSDDHGVVAQPAILSSQVKAPERGTVADYLFNALLQGASLTQLSSETGWSESTVLVNLRIVAKKTGIGIYRREDRLSLILPKGRDTLDGNAEALTIHRNINAKAAEVVINAGIDQF